ncbi:MAG: ArnT family glycosyltransferase [Desulfomonilaceae bacterium]
MWVGLNMLTQFLRGWSNRGFLGPVVRRYFFVVPFLLVLYVAGFLYLYQAFFNARPRFFAFAMSILGISLLFPATVLVSIFISQNVGGFLNKIVNSSKKLVMKRGLLVSILVSLSATSVIIFLVYNSNSIIDDEYAYVFQARTYLTGNLFLPPPPAPECISRTFMIINHVWTTKYLWGHPSLLAIGMLLGSAYLATILMALTSLVLLYSITRHIYSSKELAMTASFLMGISPWFWFVSGTLVTNVSMLFLILLFIYCWLKLERYESFFLGLASGICLGWSFTVRPLTALCFAIPFTVLRVPVYLRENPKRWVSPLIGLGVGGGIVMTLVFAYNAAVTGDPLTFPFLYYQIKERLGFGIRNHGIFTPAIAISHLFKNVFLINMWLFGWPISFLPFLAYLAGRFVKLSEAIRKVPNRHDLIRISDSWDTVWLAFIFCLFLGYFFYYWPLVVLTIPMYYYELLIPLTILSAKGLIYVHNALSKRLLNFQNFIPAFVLLSFTTCVFCFVPVRSEDIIRRYAVFRKPFELARRHISEKALILVGKTEKFNCPIQCLPYPSPNLDDKLLFVSFRNSENSYQALRTFPDRSPYVLFYDNKSNRYIVKRLKRGNKLSDQDLSHCVGMKRGNGKIDRTPPSARIVFLLSLIGFDAQPRKQ